MFGIRRQVAASIGGPADRIALGWLDDRQVVARLRVGRGFDHKSFAIPPDDESLVAAIVAWVVER